MGDFLTVSVAGLLLFGLGGIYLSARRERDQESRTFTNNGLTWIHAKRGETAKVNDGIETKFQKNDIYENIKLLSFINSDLLDTDETPRHLADKIMAQYNKDNKSSRELYICTDVFDLDIESGCILSKDGKYLAAPLYQSKEKDLNIYVYSDEYFAISNENSFCVFTIVFCGFGGE